MATECPDCYEPMEPGHDETCVVARLLHEEARGLAAVPNGASKPCSCGGTHTPSIRVPADLHLDADGTAMVTLRCTSTSCRIESVHYWTWSD